MNCLYCNNKIKIIDSYLKEDLNYRYCYTCGIFYTYQHEILKESGIQIFISKKVFDVFVDHINNTSKISWKQDGNQNIIEINSIIDLKPSKLSSKLKLYLTYY